MIVRDSRVQTDLPNDRAIARRNLNRTISLPRYNYLVLLPQILRALYSTIEIAKGKLLDTSLRQSVPAFSASSIPRIPRPLITYLSPCIPLYNTPGLEPKKTSKAREAILRIRQRRKEPAINHHTHAYTHNMPHSTKPSRPNTPALPIELWMHILSFVSDTEDLPQVWFAARASCRLLRIATEAAFPAAHLRRWLHVCSFRIPRAALAFNRIADGNKGRAVLRAEPWKGFEDKPGRRTAGQSVARGEAMLDESVARDWMNVLQESSAKRFGDHMVCLRGVVQDTEVAGWSVVSGEDGVFEVEVDWKEMLNRLFGEELRARRRGEVLVSFSSPYFHLKATY